MRPSEPRPAGGPEGRRARDGRRSRLRIALVIDALGAGGAEAVVGELARGLARRGHVPLVYCLRPAGADSEELRARGVVVREPQVPGSLLATLGRLWRWMRSDRPDVVHAHSSSALIASMLPARLAGARIVHTRHGGLLGPRSLYRRLADAARGSVDLRTCVARSLRGLPRGSHGGAGWYVPNGVDRARIPRGAARAALEAVCGRRFAGPVVLTVGSICREKDTCGLLRAFARLRGVEPEAELVCVGPVRDADYLARARAIERALGLSGRVVWAGPVANAWRLMAGADVFCLPSRSEAAPIALLEAMSQRVPIVATAVGDVGPPPGASGAAPTRGPRRPRRASTPTGPRGGGTAAPPPWLIEHGRTGLLVPPNDAVALADALAQCLSDRAAARRRARRAEVEQRRRFCAARMVRGYERVYAHMLSGRRRRLARGASDGRRRRVLMVGPGAPSVGGMVSVIETLLASPLRDRFAAGHFATNERSRPGAPRAAGGAGRFASTIAAVWRHAASAFALTRRIVRERVDIVHVHTASGVSMYRSLVDLVLARLLGRIALLHVHGGRFARDCAERGRATRWLVRRGLQAAHAVIVLSPRFVTLLRPYAGSARIVCVPNGVRVPSEPAAVRVAGAGASGAGAGCRFLFLGALTESKGVGDLIRAAEIVRDAGTPFELVIAGPGTPPQRDDLAARIRAADLEPCVRLCGSVDPDERARLLERCDCLVLPSRVEALPMVVLEAAAHGRPVIAADVGAVRDVIGRIGLVVPPGDACALAAGMVRLARDPALRGRMGRALRRRVARRFSDVAQARRLERVYDSVRRPRRGPRATARAWWVRNVVYPVHERMLRRATLRELRSLERLSVASRADVQRDAAERLSGLLSFAAQNLPFYRERFAAAGLTLPVADPEAALRRLPPLTKPEVRAHARKMVWHDCPDGLIPHSSGGTSGDTLHFYVDRLRQAQTLAARLFMQSLFGVRPGERRVYLWGSPIEQGRGAPAAARRLRRWRDRMLNEFLIDAFDMSPRRLEEHAARIAALRPALLYGYPSAVALLARHMRRVGGARRDGREARAPRLIVLTGETASAEQVALIREAFGCRVAMEYGSREVGLIAHECPQGRMHVIAPHVHVEVLRGGRPAAPGEPGEVVCTTLNARAQPLIRYALGDVAAAGPDDCACGLPFPVLERVAGKVTGFIVGPDGRWCHGAFASHALRDRRGIVEFKTYQRAVDRFEVLLVADRDFDATTPEVIRRRYRAMFGPRVRVDCRLVDRIPPDPSGKRRYLVSQVVTPPDQLAFRPFDPPG